MKNNKNKIIYLILFFFSLVEILNADEFNINASSIKLLQNGDKILAEGDVFIVGQNGITFESEMATYDKKKNIIDAKRSVKVTDPKTNDILLSDKINYSKAKEKIVADGNVIFKGGNGITIKTEKAVYDNKNQTIKSNNFTRVNDGTGNTIEMDMFKYSTNNKNLRSKGNVQITDKDKNKYYFDDLLVDMTKKRMAGSNVKIQFNKEAFGNIENDPRLAGNSAIITEDKSVIENGIFTTCKKNGDKCPPWKLTAKKVIHDKKKQKINYENAKLYLYDVPIFYAPRFFHPDPTVKRQSGFLAPSLMNSTLLGAGLNIPYYFAIADNRDATINPKVYADENPVVQTEYRYLTKNTYSIIDASFNQGYKNTSDKKSSGSRNHIFAKSAVNLDIEQFDESKIEFNLQKVSNDTYLKVHNIDSEIMDSNAVMNSSIKMDFSKNNSTMNINMDMYENLGNEDERYEFVAPNYDYKNKLSYAEQLGTLGFQSRGYYKNYQTNKKETKIINDFHWSSNDLINNFGVISKVEGNLKNSNYKAENTISHKNDKNNVELGVALSLLNSIPLEKISESSKSTLTPKLMIRTSPGHMRDMSNEQLKLNTSNLYSLNKLGNIDVIETGTSLALGSDYSYKNNKNDYEKINLSVGQVFRFDENNKMSKQSTLGQKSSELVGKINYNINEFNKIGYNFSLDQNYNDLNYNEITGLFKINKLVTNFEYLEENNHIGDTHYLNTGISLKLDKSNSLKFETRENFTTETTEFYNLSYQYENDCLKAAIQYNKNFYSDNDLAPTEDIMFTLTIVPFGKLSTPVINR